MTHELTDRLALSDLVAQYAIAVDRRDETVLAALFTTDARLVQPPELVRSGQDPVRSGAAEIASSILHAVSHLRSTRHVVAQQLVEIAGDTARGETYCEAHHVYPVEDGHRDYVVELRYLDEYHRADGSWRIARRELVVDFTYTRAVDLRG